ncbi:hypothetical protein [Pengzhenrongella sp.]|jgi:hypothetical protein|uniref:hypothetical protein n=1 Tax=Pengzhenrongella sp. TaxID=2888820 RepID=UPI002F9379B8
MAEDARRTQDNDGRRRVGPGGRKDVRDFVLPYRHGKYWNWDPVKRQSETAAHLMARMPLDTEASANACLQMAELVAKSAIDRAEAADHRASTIAGSVSIAASFTLSAAGLLLDESKWPTDSRPRTLFAIVLCLTTGLFVLAALYSLRALVSKKTRYWKWIDPNDLWAILGESTAEGRTGLRAARLLDNFASNWEIADLKNRNIDNALRCVLCALSALTGLAVIAASTVW